MRMPAQFSGAMRKPAQYAMQRQAQVKSFPAPIGGLIANRSLAQPNQPGQPQGAARLDNWFPTATGVTMRRGSQKYAQLGDGTKDVTSIFSYKNGAQEQLFATTDEAVYNITSVHSTQNYMIDTNEDDLVVTDAGDTIGQDSTEGLDVLDGLTGGDWVVVQFATTGGIFLVGVNGQDDGFIYDGTNFYPNVAGGIWSLTLTNITTPFTEGEVMTGGTSDTTATVDKVDGNTVWLKGINPGPTRFELKYTDASSPFSIGDTITGEISDATAVVDQIPQSGTLWLTGITDGPTRYELAIDDEDPEFQVGETVTGVTSGASLVIEHKIGENKLWATAVTEEPKKYRLDYHDGTAAFSVGSVVTGDVTGATGTVSSKDGTSTNGTLWLTDVSGTFANGEGFSGDGGGAAIASGSSAYVSGGPFIRFEEITGDMGGEGTVTTPVVELDSVPFRDGERISNGTGSEATTNGTVTETTDYSFIDGEHLTGDQGGEADADGVPSQIAPGVSFPEGVNLSTADFSYVWTYKNRLFFVQKNSLDSWYLPVDAIGGELTKFPLGGVFDLGGSLYFGENWSLDSGSGGSGLSQQCIFVTTQGQVAVFDGTNPSSATDWRNVGVYRIGKPLGKKAHIRAGGDKVIATDIGFVPLSQAVQRDFAALSPGAVSYKIEDIWNEAAFLRSSEEWKCEIWPDQQMVIVALPTVNEESPEWFVANARTGAWAVFTGWDATCVEVFQGRCFFGSREGFVIEANVTGADQGDPYTSVYVPLFDDFRAPTTEKLAKMARSVMRAKISPRDQISLMTEFEVDLPPAPDAVPVPVDSVWDAGTWGQSVWGEERPPNTYQTWRVIDGMGYAVSTAQQITSGSLAPLDVELVRIDLSFTATDAIV